MKREEAQRLTDEIRTQLGRVNGEIDRLTALLDRARDGGAAEALGYASWTAYLVDVLGDDPLRLGREDRRQMVSVLTSAGMSTRATAAVLGVGKDTVRRDLDAVGADAEPRTVVGLNGKSYTTRPIADDEIAVTPGIGYVRSRPGARERLHLEFGADELAGWIAYARENGIDYRAGAANAVRAYFGQMVQGE